MPFSRKKPEIQGGLSGTALKYIAMTTMLADHIGAVLLAVSYTHLRAHET